MLLFNDTINKKSQQLSCILFHLKLYFNSFWRRSTFAPGEGQQTKHRYFVAVIRKKNPFFGWSKTIICDQIESVWLKNSVSKVSIKNLFLSRFSATKMFWNPCSDSHLRFVGCGREGRGMRHSVEGCFVLGDGEGGCPGRLSAVWHCGACVQPAVRPSHV